MEIGLLIITDGRKELLDATVNSARQNLICNFKTQIIVNDSQDQEYQIYLSSLYPDFTIINNIPKAGFSGSINAGWKALSKEVDYIFHLEEDFLFEQEVEISNLVELLQRSGAYQMMFKRDAVLSNPIEAEYGGYIEANPHLYEQHDGYILHNNFFSTNPCIYSTTICKFGWPEGQGEIEFFNQIKNVDKEAKCGIVGNKFDKPLVRHIGYFRNDGWKI
jgi:hypothetical protein